MMEKLGAPQTHLGLKNMIKEVDEDFDGKLSFREVRDRPRHCTGAHNSSNRTRFGPHGHHSIIVLVLV